jgi:hypothetical protein
MLTTLTLVIVAFVAECSIGPISLNKGAALASRRLAMYRQLYLDPTRLAEKVGLVHKVLTRRTVVAHMEDLGKFP